VAAQRILVVEDEAPIRHLCSFGHTQIRGDGIDLFVVHQRVIAESDPRSRFELPGTLYWPWSAVRRLFRSQMRDAAQRRKWPEAR
jgi:hypothetical protein